MTVLIYPGIIILFYYDLRLRVYSCYLFRATKNSLYLLTTIWHVDAFASSQLQVRKTNHLLHSPPPPLPGSCEKHRNVGSKSTLAIFMGCWCRIAVKKMGALLYAVNGLINPFTFTFKSPFINWHFFIQPAFDLHPFASELLCKIKNWCSLLLYINLIKKLL